MIFPIYVVNVLWLSCGLPRFIKQALPPWPTMTRPRELEAADSVTDSAVESQAGAALGIRGLPESTQEQRLSTPAKETNNRSYRYHSNGCFSGRSLELFKSLVARSWLSLAVHAGLGAAHSWAVRLYQVRDCEEEGGWDNGSSKGGPLGERSTPPKRRRVN